MKRLALFACIAALFCAAGADAQTRRKTAILMPGAGGIHPNDFLVRNKDRFDAAGFETIVTTSPGEAASAARTAQAEGRKAVIVGMSRGAGHAAQAVASGAPVAGVVFVSGVIEDMMSGLGSPSVLPAALLVHNCGDECPLTSPEGAQDFVRWTRGKAQIRWITTRGPPMGRACGPHGAHGFHHQDGAPIAAIIGFIRSR